MKRRHSDGTAAGRKYSRRDHRSRRSALEVRGGHQCGAFASGRESDRGSDDEPAAAFGPLMVAVVWK